MKKMDSKTLKALIDAGVVKHASIIADGATIHIKFTTRNGASTPVTTLKGAIKTWSTIALQLSGYKAWALMRLS
jgi:hypothetical protein